MSAANHKYIAPVPPRFVTEYESAYDLKGFPGKERLEKDGQAAVRAGITSYSPKLPLGMSPGDKFITPVPPTYVTEYEAAYDDFPGKEEKYKRPATETKKKDGVGAKKVPVGAKLMTQNEETSTYSVWTHLQTVAKRLVDLECPDAAAIAALSDILAHRQLDARLDLVAHQLLDTLDREAHPVDAAADGDGEQENGHGAPSVVVAFGRTVSKTDTAARDIARRTSTSRKVGDGSAEAKRWEDVLRLYREFVDCVRAIKSC
jgi:hypothetical protein